VTKHQFCRCFYIFCHNITKNPTQGVANRFFGLDFKY